MKTTQHLWMKRLATGAAAIVLPLAAWANSRSGDFPEGCPPMPCAGSPMRMQPPGMFPEVPPPGTMLPYLRGLELTDAQQDKLFALLHEQAPTERERLKASLNAMEELRRSVASEHFDVGKARVLAETYAQALGQMTLMHAELDAKVRALLTPEQRKQLGDAHTNSESRRNIKCS
jgi:Spy/CpxP family protein refolding chaperone